MLFFADERGEITVFVPLARPLQPVGRVLAGPIRERYLLGSYDTSDETRWRTEIGWPILRTDPH